MTCRLDQFFFARYTYPSIACRLLNRQTWDLVVTEIAHTFQRRAASWQMFAIQTTNCSPRHFSTILDKVPRFFLHWGHVCAGLVTVSSPRYFDISPTRCRFLQEMQGAARQKTRRIGAKSPRTGAKTRKSTQNPRKHQKVNRPHPPLQRWNLSNLPA